MTPPRSQVSPSDGSKDERVMGFMKQIIKEKHGQNIEEDFLNQEADMLYNKFTERLTSYFKQFISKEQEKELNKLIGQSANQDVVLTFLMESIDNFEAKIIYVLMNFRNDYLKNSGMQKKS